MKIQRPSPAMAVALLALFVALGGAGYAAVRLPKNSVGPKQLKRNAVRSAKVKDHSLLEKDFRTGQLPAGPKGDKGDTGLPGPTFGAAALGSQFEPATDPVAAPDESSGAVNSSGRHFDVTLPASGNIYVRFFSPSWGVTCSSGGGRAGFYLDGQPAPDSGRPLPPGTASEIRPVEIVGVMAAGAGPHSLEVRADCPNGTFNGGLSVEPPDWTVLLLG